jgi:predicted transport protein
MKAKKVNSVFPINFNYKKSVDAFDNYIKSNSDWIKFKNKYKIPDKYITDENKDLFIFMKNSGLNAEQAFLSKIKEIENICKK